MLVERSIRKDWRDKGGRGGLGQAGHSHDGGADGEGWPDKIKPSPTLETTKESAKVTAIYSDYIKNNMILISLFFLFWEINRVLFESSPILYTDL